MKAALVGLSPLSHTTQLGNWAIGNLELDVIAKKELTQFTLYAILNIFVFFFSLVSSLPFLERNPLFPFDISQWRGLILIGRFHQESEAIGAGFPKDELSLYLFRNAGFIHMAIGSRFLASLFG